MNALIKPLFKTFRGPLLSFFRFFNRQIRKVASFTHKVQFYLEWSLKPNPEWFDHNLDLFYQWGATSNPLCWERGIFNLFVMKPNARVLDICCGDGFNAHHFYRIRAKSVLGIDFDPKAIKHAQKNFNADNVEFKLVDIRKDFPTQKFDQIIWDGAIEHFTQGEMQRIIGNIKNSLADGGILSGYTIVHREDGHSHDDHEYEFVSVEDLQQFLQPLFKHVQVFDTEYPDRHNLYFYCSDKPFVKTAEFATTQIPVAEMA
jgi:SAM-dependent methyltransferase